MKHKKPFKNQHPEALPDDYQLEAEIEEAEVTGAHKEPVDLLDVACEAEVAGHLYEEFDDLVKPTVEDLSR